MSLLDEQFRAWEAALQRQPMSVKRCRDDDRAIELRRQLPPSEMLANDELAEKWAQDYVKEEFSRFGFTKLDGPFRRGPDFNILHKRKWFSAEVETRWQNYFRHNHHLNSAFDKVEYLILLSAEAPPVDKLDLLPPRILHIDQQHFLEWHEKAAKSKLLGMEYSVRTIIVAMAMQHHWTTICCDVDREMATCPNCDSCAYFGNGGFGEATPFYQDMASRYLWSIGLTDDGFADLGKVKAADIEQLVENNPPGDN